MAANLGSLVATITANTKPFSKGMAKAKGDTGKLQGQTKKFSMKSMLGKLALAAGAAVLFAKALAGVKDQMAELDKLGKTADKLGIGVQELERLRFAAGKAGIEAGAFDKSLEKMARSVSEAAHGTGVAKDALAQLGIVSADLAQQSPDKQMMILADAIKGIQNPAEKARVAYQIFGRAGVDMINMMQGGSAAIEEQGKRFDELNGIMSRADIKGIEEANDAWMETKTAIKGAWRTFTIAIAPVLEGLANMFTWLVKITKWLFKPSPLAKWFGFGKKDKAAQGIKKQKEMLPLLEDQIAKEKAIVEEKAKAADAIKKQGEAITAEFLTPQEKFQEKIDNLNTLVNAGAISWQTYNKAIAKSVDNLKDANKQTDDLAKPRKAIGAVRRGTSAAISAVKASERYMKDMKDQQKRQVAEQIETNRILANIDNNTSGNAVVAVNI